MRKRTKWLQEKEGKGEKRGLAMVYASFIRSLYTTKRQRQADSERERMNEKSKQAYKHINKDTDAKQERQTNKAIPDLIPGRLLPQVMTLDAHRFRNPRQSIRGPERRPAGPSR